MHPRSKQKSKIQKSSARISARKNNTLNIFAVRQKENSQKSQTTQNLPSGKSRRKTRAAPAARHKPQPIRRQANSGRRNSARNSPRGIYAP
ncbi:hypothetical protein ACUN3E_08635, partial [Streptomyces sp. Ju416(a)]